MSRLLHTFSKPISIGIVAAFATPLVFSGTIYYIPASIFVGATALVASAIEESTKNYFIPMIISDPAGPVAINIAAPILTGLSLTALMFIMDGTSLEMSTAFKGFLLGADSELVGNYFNDDILVPLITSNPIY